MKILIITEVYFPDLIGGAGKYAYSLAAGLLGKGHRISVITRQLKDLPMSETKEGIKIFRADWGRVFILFRPFVYSFRLQRIIKEIKQEEGVDLIFFNQPFPAFCVLLSKEAKGISKVCNFHSSWPEELEIKLGIKEVRGYALHKVLKRWFFKPVLFFMSWIEGWVLKRVRSIIVLSRFSKQRIIDLYKITAEKIEIINAGVDTAKFFPIQDKRALRRQFGLPGNNLILFTARNLVARMGLDNLIAAFAEVIKQYPETYLVIAGGGPLEKKLKRLAGNLNLAEKIRFTGSLSEADLRQYYQLADLFILPTKYLEGFGLVTLEAMASGLPVLGTPVGGTVEILEKFDRDFLVNGTSPQSIADKIIEFLDKKPDFDVLKKRCRDFVLKEYSPDKWIERVDDYFRSKIRIKVLHIHTRAIVGGSGTNTLLSMAGLPADRFEPVLACGSEGPLPDAARSRGLKTVIILHLQNRVNLFNDFLALKEIIALLRQEDFAIVHTHNSKAGILGRWAAKLCKVPVVVHTMHSCVFCYPNLNFLQRRFFFLLEKWAQGITDKIIFISEGLKKEFIAAGIDSQEKFVTIYSGIEVERFRLQIVKGRETIVPGILSGDLVVGCIGRLAEGKGHEFIIQAIPLVAKEIPGVKFVFVGEGPLKKRLENLAQRLKVKGKTIFTGERADIAEFLSAFDVFCSASLYEGMGRVFLEAQAAGKPIVATRVGGITDVVRENETALLVSPKDYLGLAQALISLLKDKDMHNRMSRAAREFVDYRFSAQKMVEDIIKVYNELLKPDGKND